MRNYLHGFVENGIKKKNKSWVAISRSGTHVSLMAAPGFESRQTRDSSRDDVLSRVPASTGEACKEGFSLEGPWLLGRASAGRRCVPPAQQATFLDNKYKIL